MATDKNLSIFQEISKLRDILTSILDPTLNEKHRVALLKAIQLTNVLADLLLENAKLKLDAAKDGGKGSKIPLAEESKLNQKLTSSLVDIDLTEEEMVELKAMKDRKKGLHILLAEDNLISQRLTSSILEKAGYIVSVANNGKEAVSTLKNKKIDIVVMDIQMPEMDGITATKEIRSSKEPDFNNKIPIIGLSGYLSPECKQRALNAGMNECIAKPLVAKIFFSALKKFE